jgi:hypothetical protein
MKLSAEQTEDPGSLNGSIDYEKLYKARFSKLISDEISEKFISISIDQRRGASHRILYRAETHIYHPDIFDALMRSLDALKNSCRNQDIHIRNQISNIENILTSH